MNLNKGISALAVATLTVTAGCGLASNSTADAGKLGAKRLELETVYTTYAGDEIYVKIDKLSKKEHYTIRIDNYIVDKGKANSDGEVYTEVKVPKKLDPGNHTITGTGAFPNRYDRDRLKIKKNHDDDEKK